MTTHDPALLWAADRAGLPYDRFVTGLTPSTIRRIRAAYCRRNGTKILMPAVKTAQPVKTAPLAVDVTSALLKCVNALPAPARIRGLGKLSTSQR